MKKWSLILGLTITLTSCDSLLQVLGTANEVLSETGGITEGEAADGLKQALTKGVGSGTDFLGKTDGFLKNAAYKILMPKEVRDVEQKIRGTTL